MDKLIGSTLVLLLIVVALVGMYVSWRKKSRQDSRFSVAAGIPLRSDSVVHGPEFSVFYVATTLAIEPLHRINLPGLSFRADAHITVGERGLLISPRGEHESFIPKHNILQIHRSQVTIDKAVEKDGLTAISWQGFDNVLEQEVEFTSYFRISIPEIRSACETALTDAYSHTPRSTKEVPST